MHFCGGEVVARSTGRCLRPSFARPQAGWRTLALGTDDSRAHCLGIEETSAGPGLGPSAGSGRRVDPRILTDRLLRDLRARRGGLTVREAERCLIASGPNEGTVSPAPRTHVPARRHVVIGGAELWNPRPSACEVAGRSSTESPASPDPTTPSVPRPWSNGRGRCEYGLLNRGSLTTVGYGNRLPQRCSAVVNVIHDLRRGVPFSASASTASDSRSVHCE